MSKIELINTLHKEFNKYANIPAKDKPLLVSGILLALQDETFKKSYEDYSNEELADKLFEVIQQDELESVYNFITARDEFRNDNNKLQENPLKYFIRYIDEYIKPAIEQNSNIDVLGKFYAGLDGKGLGIVLTPTHICNLMVELAGVNKDSIVLDTCTGTAGLLIAAMMKMIEDANGDEEKIDEIKRNQLIGVELQTHMYALACSNMILRGDGKANMHLGSCFEKTETLNELGIYPTAGIINPPYSQKVKGLLELDFIENLLNTLDIGGKGVAIVPMSVATECSDKVKLEIRKRILENHTLDAVIKMPLDLFKGTADIQTVIMVFTAKIPHNKNKETWLADWSNDGFVWTKKEGRIPGPNWNSIHDQWIYEYLNRKEIPGHSINVSLTAEQEWCHLQYIETDYSKLTNIDFEKSVFYYYLYTKGITKKDKLYEISTSDILNNKETFNDKKNNFELDIAYWDDFLLSDLFELENGKGYLSGEASEYPGENPFACSSEFDNGIACYTSLMNTHSGNCLTINKDGSIGHAFYQEKDFSTNKHVVVATPKHEKFNKYNALFITTIIKQESFRYSFNKSWGTERMQTSTIKLPVNANGEPDYEFMESYIKSLPYSKHI